GGRTVDYQGEDKEEYLRANLALGSAVAQPATLVSEVSPVAVIKDTQRPFRLGILTGGGPASGHNAAIYAIVKAATERGWQVIGIPFGWKGLVDEKLLSQARVLTLEDVEPHRHEGGTILGTSRENPYSEKNIKAGVPAILWAGVQRLQLDALGSLGGDDTNGVASKLWQEHPEFPIIGLPKTMDNDLALPHGASTWGFKSFVQAAVAVVRHGLIDALSTGTLLVAEVFGRNAGFVAQAIGAIVGAVRTLIPEEGDIDLEKLINDVANYYKGRSSKAGVIIVSEGIKIRRDFANNAAILDEVFAQNPKVKVAFESIAEVDQFGHPKLEDAALIISAVLKFGLKKEGIQPKLAGKLDYFFRSAPISEDDFNMCLALGEASVDYIARGHKGELLYYLDQEVLSLPLTVKLGGRTVDYQGEDKEEYLRANLALNSADPARSQSGLPLTQKEVGKEIIEKVPQTKKVTTKTYQKILESAELVKKFLLAIDRAEWIPRLEELLADMGRLRAGPFSLFYGALYEGIFYFASAFLNSPLSLALTILHELGALQGLTHEQNLQLESDFITYLSSENLSPLELITVVTEKGIVGVEVGRFPDDEWNPLVLNPYLLASGDATVSYRIESCADLVKIMLVMDTLRFNRTERMHLVLERHSGIFNDLATIFLYSCNSLKYYDGSVVRDFVGCLPALIQKRGLGILVHRVLYQHARFKPDAEEAAEIIHAHAERVEIEKPGANPFDWGILLPQGLQGQNVALVHSTENDLDIVELWLMLLALRKAGVGSVSLINSYAGYSRQDKVFRLGEGISALTMLKIISALTDTYFAANIHYGNKSGFLGLPGYPFRLYNMNAFVQLAENLFDFVVEQVDAFTIIGKLKKIQDKKVFGQAGAWVLGRIIYQLRKRYMKAELKAHPLLVLAPDDGASEYVKEAAEVLEHYIKDNYGITVNMQRHFGYMDKVRTGSTSVEIPAYILSTSEEYLTRVDEVEINQCWVFLLDDETSWGTTLLSATYVLRRGMHFSWQRILSGPVHGKFANGLEPFRSGFSEEEISSAVRQGDDIEPKPEYVDETRKLMPPRIVVSTKSVAAALALPEKQQVSIGPLVSYAVKRIIGSAAEGDMFRGLVSGKSQKPSRGEMIASAVNDIQVACKLSDEEEVMRKLVFYKFGDPSTVGAFARELIALIRNCLDQPGEWAVAVRHTTPAHPTELLAQYLAQELGMDIIHLETTNWMMGYPELPADLRHSIVKDSTRVAPISESRVFGRRVIIIDDFIESGATMTDAARALFVSNASEVRTFVLFDWRQTIGTEKKIYQYLFAHPELIDELFARMHGEFSQSGIKYLIRMANEYPVFFLKITRHLDDVGLQKILGSTLAYLPFSSLEQRPAVIHFIVSLLCPPLYKFLNLEERLAVISRVKLAIPRGVTSEMNDTLFVSSQDWITSSLAVIYAYIAGYDYLVFEDRRTMTEEQIQEAIEAGKLLKVSVCSPYFTSLPREIYAADESEALPYNIGDIPGLAGLRIRLAEARKRLRAEVTSAKINYVPSVNNYIREVRAIFEETCGLVLDYLRRQGLELSIADFAIA
ncbi:MAG: 6-phosphofructokinase, partial [bacterium]